MKLIGVALVGVIFCWATASAQIGPIVPHLGKSPLKDVVAALTLEEKARLVVGMGLRLDGLIPPSNNKNGSSKDTILSLSAFGLPPIDSADNIPEKVPGAAGRTHAVARLGIPSVTVSDGPAGVRIAPVRKGDSSMTYYATAFPSGTLLASTWDTALVRKLGNSFGNEIREYGVDVILGPAMNIQRNPLGGRNFEYYSEDPLVAGSISAAMINGIQAEGVGTSVKHFVANNQETNRNSINTIVSERALREIYLRGFEIAIKKAKPWTVMTSYNKVNGTYTSQRRDLVTTILKNEWGFKGTVMTDWFGGNDPVAQMKAGNDLIMPGSGAQSRKIVEAVRSGVLSEKQLDENVTRILRLVMASPEFRKYHYSNKPDLAAHAATTRAAAAEGMILLKNEGAVLPLKKGLKIASFGNATYDIVVGGTGSGSVNTSYKISLAKGLTNAGYSPDPTIASEYENYLAEEKIKHPKPAFAIMPPVPTPELVPDADALQQQAAKNDIAIFTLSRNAGEIADRKVNYDYELTDAEKGIIKSVSDAFHAKGKKLVVVLNIGGVVDVTSWRDWADGILLSWQPGLEAGNSIADVLSGKVNPSGKLAVTFPAIYKDDPTAKNFPGRELPDTATHQAPSFMRGKPSEVVYEEGIYVGYRYYNTFKVKPAYPFGYGLSYTSFTYGKLNLSSATLTGKLTASITVTNSGKTAGREIVQLYVSAPGKKLDKPESELRGFAKTKMLAPGESQTLSFSITPAALASFDTPSSSWITESGRYTLKIAASSADIRLTKEFSVPVDVVVEKVNKVLAPEVPINELKH